MRCILDSESCSIGLKDDQCGKHWPMHVCVVSDVFFVCVHLTGDDGLLQKKF